MLPIYYAIADKSRAIKYIHNSKREHISIIKKKQKEPVIYPVFFVLFCLFCCGVFFCCLFFANNQENEGALVMQKKNA